MPSALTALPTLTATALGASLATGIPAGQYKAPTVVVGYTVPMDGLNFYVQAQPNPLSGVFLNITSTATGTNTSSQQTNTVHRGTTLMINTVSVGATCTLGINLLSQDATTGSGLSTQVARASLDGIVASGMYAVIFYPALPNSGGGPSQSTNFTQASGVLPVTYRIQVSLTATASGGGANMSYSLAEQKTL